jgi:hypothetical protein
MYCLGCGQLSYSMHVEEKFHPPNHENEEYETEKEDED